MSVRSFFDTSVLIFADDNAASRNSVGRSIWLRSIADRERGAVSLPGVARAFVTLLCSQGICHTREMDGIQIVNPFVA